ncbi:hypothetical protein CFBP6773_01671 [Xanthomonas arboricola pv. fragariae]|nr:hypothetical protein CFBP6773_01671 [Xanthomonas arboricola pv. fragariae]
MASGFVASPHPPLPQERGFSSRIPLRTLSGFIPFSRREKVPRGGG